MQAVLGCGFVAHVSEEVVDASLLVHCSMRVSYLIEIVLGFAVLMVVTVCVRTLDSMLSVEDFAAAMLMTPHVTVAYFLAITLLLLFIMRSTTLMASTARQLMTFGRSCESKALNFLDECDGSPAPRTALIVITIVTGGFATLSLLREYRIVFEHIRRLGALCTLTSYLVSIGSLCVHRIRINNDLGSTKRRAFEIFAMLLDWFALGFCFWFFTLVNLPAELPITWANGPWSLAIWLFVLVWTLIWYQRLAKGDFLQGPLLRSQDHVPVVPTEPTELTVLNTPTVTRSETLQNLNTRDEVNVSPSGIPQTGSSPNLLLRGSRSWSNVKPLSVGSGPPPDVQRTPKDRTNLSHEKGKEPEWKCLEPSECPRGRVPDIGSSESSKPLCANCETRLSELPVDM